MTDKMNTREYEEWSLKEVEESLGRLKKIRKEIYGDSEDKLVAQLSQSASEMRLSFERRIKDWSGGCDERTEENA